MQIHPERNQTVVEKNGKVHGLLSTGEARELRFSLRNADVKLTSEIVKNIDGSYHSETTFTLDGNTYKLYAL